MNMIETLTFSHHKLKYKRSASPAPESAVVCGHNSPVRPATEVLSAYFPFYSSNKVENPQVTLASIVNSRQIARARTPFPHVIFLIPVELCTLDFNNLSLYVYLNNFIPFQITFI